MTRKIKEGDVVYLKKGIGKETLGFDCSDCYGVPLKVHINTNDNPRYSEPYVLCPLNDSDMPHMFEWYVYDDFLNEYFSSTTNPIWSDLI